MEALLKAILDMIVKFFSPNEGTNSDLVLDYIPQLGDKSRNTLMVQSQLNKLHSATLTEDGDFGPATLREVQAFQRKVGLPGSGKIGTITIKELGLKLKTDNKYLSVSDPVWMTELEKHRGKVETDAKFQEYMNPFWKKSGLDFKGLVGSARAWCALFVFMGLTIWGFKTPINSFRAKAWDNWGHSIDWKKDGFPRGAIIRINHNGNCTSASNNHLTTARGDCTAEDLNKPNATFAEYGGNVSNMAKVAIRKVSTICYVAWPKEKKNGTQIPKPPRVTVSKNCTSTGSTNESSR